MDDASGLSKRTIALLAVTCGVAVANVYAMQPLLGLVGDDLHLARGSSGWLVAAAQLGYLVGLVVLVPLGDVVDRRRLIAGHLVLTAAGALLTAVSGTAALAFVGLGVAGLFAVVVQTTVAYAATQSPPERRGASVGAVTSGVVIGILGARVVSGALGQALGWRSVYAVLAGACVVAALAVLVVLPSDRDRPRLALRDAASSGARLVAHDPLLRGRGLVAFFLFASFGTLWSGLALPLGARPWQLSSTQIGLFGLAGLAGALAAGRAGRWADAGHGAKVTTFSLALLVASWGLTALVGRSLVAVIAGVVLLDFAVQAVHVSNQHALTAAHPQRASSVIGAYMAFYSCGSAIGAVTTTAAYTTVGWTGACVLGAGFATAGLVVHLAAAGLTRRARAGAPWVRRDRPRRAPARD